MTFNANCFWNYVDIGCSLEFKDGFGNMTRPYLKILKGTLLETPCIYTYVSYMYVYHMYTFM